MSISIQMYTNLAAHALENELRAEQRLKNGVKLLGKRYTVLSAKREKVVFSMMLTKAARKQIAFSRYSKKIIQAKATTLALERAFLVSNYHVAEIVAEKNEYKKFK